MTIREWYRRFWAAMERLGIQERDWDKSYIRSKRQQLPEDPESAADLCWCELEDSYGRAV